MRRTLTRLCLLLALLIGCGAVLGGLVAVSVLRGSLARTTGRLALAGLSTPVQVARDARGVPRIAAASRADAARALGFVHAQERFFQMDLQRRRAAGELAALVGARALPLDRQSRVYRMRHVAREVLVLTPPSYRTLLDAYAAGVNAGLTALASAPFEYALLGEDPAPWTPEDSVLTVLAMFDTLQDRQLPFETSLAAMHEALPAPLYTFLAAAGSDWDAPVAGGPLPRPPIPGPQVFDTRRERPDARTSGNRRPPGPSGPAFDLRTPDGTPLPAFVLADMIPTAGLGSNNWAVDGAHTVSGAAMVANDMHLQISVPNIWYGATIVVDDGRGQDLLTGFTLPGLPSLVVGSNGHVAWGFTNSGGDWSDIISIVPDPRNDDGYLTADGPRTFDTFVETLDVANGTPEPLLVKSTIWGPIVGTDARGRALARQWVALDPSALASDLTRPEHARTAADALDRFAGLGIPGQNVVVGDTAGHIGWTIAGPMPDRHGRSGLLPTWSTDAASGWTGYLAPADFPRIVDPPGGRIWTANSPVVTDARVAVIGDGGYADGIRAAIIRDRLAAIDRATPRDMLDVQLDTSARFLERWRALLLEVLAPPVVAADAGRAELRRLVDTTWTGRASPDSAAYRLVRTFRLEVGREVFRALLAPVRHLDPDFDYARTFRSEGPLWQIVAARPPHLVPPGYAAWDAALLGAADATIARLTASGGVLADRTWGEYNRADIAHPLASAIPFFGRWLRLPATPLPGDVYMPRAHSPRTGPSERLVVSPGHETAGLAHMPGGQSGHPLSPHFSDQQAAWLEGIPLPLLPGPPVETLVLTPP